MKSAHQHSQQNNQRNNKQAREIKGAEQMQVETRNLGADRDTFRESHVRSNSSVWTPGIRTIRPIQRDAIPERIGRGKSGLRALQVMSDMDKLLTGLQESGAAPYDVVGEVDMADPEILQAAKGKKCFAQSFRKILQEKIEEHHLETQIGIVARGDRLFIVGDQQT